MRSCLRKELKKIACNGSFINSYFLKINLNRFPIFLLIIPLYLYDSLTVLVYVVIFFFSKCYHFKFKSLDIQWHNFIFSVAFQWACVKWRLKLRIETERTNRPKSHGHQLIFSTDRKSSVHPAGGLLLSLEKYVKCTSSAKMYII